MSQMYFIGSTQSKGTYFFYSTQLTGWVVSDLDTSKCSLRDKIATILVKEKAEVEVELERIGLGEDDADKWLVDGEDLILLLRDYPNAIEVLTVYYKDGHTAPYGAAEKQTADFVRRGRKHFNKECEP